LGLRGWSFQLVFVPLVAGCLVWRFYTVFILVFGYSGPAAGFFPRVAPGRFRERYSGWDLVLLVFVGVKFGLFFTFVMMVTRGVGGYFFVLFQLVLILFSTVQILFFFVLFS